MLTPGEFVINKRAVKRIGASNLDAINRGGAKKFAAGGAVSGTAIAGAGFAIGVLPQLLGSFQKLDDETKNIVTSISQFGGILAGLIITSKNFNNNLSKLKDNITANKELRNKSRGNIDILGSALDERLTKKKIEDFTAIDRKNQAAQARKDLKFGAPNFAGARKYSRDAAKYNEAKVVAQQAVQSNLQIGLDSTSNPATQSRFRRAIVLSKQYEAGFAQQAKAHRDTLGQTQQRIRGRISLVRTTEEERNQAIKQQKLGKIEEAALRSRLSEEDKVFKTTDKLIAKQEFLAQSTEVLNVGIAATAAGMIALGGFLEREATAKLNLGQQSARGNFIRGKTLGGVGVGASAGSAIGGAAGGAAGALFTLPVGGTGAIPGALIGSAAGGAAGAGIGGIIGHGAGSREAKAILDRVEFDRRNKQFSQLLGNVQGGQSSPLGQLGGFRTGVQGLTTRLQSANPEDKESVQGAIGNAVIGMNQFVGEIAKTSKSFEELESIVSRDMLESLANFTELPLDKVIQGFKNQIDAQNKSVKSLGLLNTEEVKQLQRLQQFNYLSASLNDAIDSVKRFSGQIDEIEGLFGGSARTTLGDQSGILGRSAGVIDRNLLANVVKQTTSGFGGRADVIGKEFLEIQQVLNKLPEIIVSATSKPFGVGSDLGHEFRDAIKVAFPGISDTIVQSINANLLKARGEGVNASDTKLISEAKKNPGGLAKQLGEGLLDASQKFIEENYKLLNQHVNDLAGLYEKRRNVEAAIVDSLGKTIDIREAKEEFGFTSRGKPVPLATGAKFDTSRLTTVAGGGPTGVAAIGAALDVTRNNILKKNIELQTAEFAKKEELLKEIEAEKSKREKLIKTLGFLSDATARNAHLAKELELVQAGNRAKFDLAKNFAFGGPEERRSIGRGGIAAGFLSRGGDINRLHPELRGGASSFLEGFGETKLGFLGGKSGNEVIRDTMERFLKGIGLTDKEAKEVALNNTTAPEQKLIDVINKNFETADKASVTLTKVLETGTNDILREIKINTDDFKKLFEKNLLLTEKGRLEEERTKAGVGAGTAASNFKVAGQIQALTPFGINKNNFTGLKNAIPQLVELAKQEKELKDKSNKFVDLRQFSDLNKKSNTFDTLTKLAGFDITAAQDSDFREDIHGNRIETGRARSFSKDVNKILLPEDITAAKANIKGKFGEGIASEIFNQDFNKSIVLGTTNKEQFGKILQDRVTDIIKQNATKGGDLTGQKQAIAGRLGLKSVPQVLIDNADKLSDLFKSLPEDVTFQGLANANAESFILTSRFRALGTQIDILNRKIGILSLPSVPLAPPPPLAPPRPPRRVIRHAGGGPIFGYGNTDNVPALLTPGEFVINKASAKKIGYGNLSKMNRAGFANGGQVGGNIAMSDNISASLNRFAQTANILSSALNNFPRMIEFNARHTVEIIHNGAQVFANLEPAMKTLVEQTILSEINRMLKSKFPGAGIM
jgi:hypothetical protein